MSQVKFASSQSNGPRNPTLIEATCAIITYLFLLTFPFLFKLHLHDGLLDSFFSGFLIAAYQLYVSIFAKKAFESYRQRNLIGSYKKRSIPRSVQMIGVVFICAIACMLLKQNMEHLNIVEGHSYLAGMVLALLLGYPGIVSVLNRNI